MDHNKTLALTIMHAPIIKDHLIEAQDASTIELAKAEIQNLGTAWYVSAWLKTFYGDHRTAFERGDHAIRFSPLALDPNLRLSNPSSG